MAKILDDYLTEEATANQLGVTPRTLRAWRQQRIGPAFVRIGQRAIFYRREAIQLWLKEIEQRPARSRDRRAA